MDTFTKVGEFHEKFGLTTNKTAAPNFPDVGTIHFRIGFMIEELAEFADACGMPNLRDRLAEVQKDLKRWPGTFYQLSGQGNLAKAADALGDLKYVTDGTAHMMGLPFNEIFAEIQRANMAKERATGADDPRSVRGSALDVVKPAGWTAPNHDPIIAAAVYNFKGFPV